ncbi:malic enzyme-like NAD(P)-binding protein [Methylocystis bryophila]|uniref:Thiamine pyrophosphate enzyme N-terminal TPP-binding domain-containing protein n=1 Tax=Methylocystis bryophila TaxID=655015 RepID=A0A1W6MUL5_9HYPH|nr:malic enzyme-like NAD(P)-binding protein [Methylocystis bryophila]ARN81179.1 hypothetical protein B1812_08890 [Methylocystis bryophila]BDV37114.1 hypothetical protein DSM21852_03670 [Methylocystis bryophila]
MAMNGAQALVKLLENHGVTHVFGIPGTKIDSVFIALLDSKIELALCAGVPPHMMLPITLDVGTNKHELLEDPLYLGLRQERVRDAAYDECIDEFVQAAPELFPRCGIQWEDFANIDATPILGRCRDKVCTYNDDIQGTAAIALEGAWLAQGRARNWLFDVNGLITAARRDLADFQKPFAHEHPPLTSFVEAVEALRPTCIIGVSTAPKLFNRQVIEAMHRRAYPRDEL